MRNRVLMAGLAVLAMAGLVGCGDNKDTTAGSTPSAGSSSSAGATGTINVFAAASLTESFKKLGAEFEAANPGSKVTFNFAGSSALAQQINQGAPADVFASAAPANMKQVTDTGAVTATPRRTRPRGHPG